MAKKKGPRRGELPPIDPSVLDAFRKRARTALQQTEADYDYTAGIYLLELRGQKYAERARRGDGKTWWKKNVEDVCPYKRALDNSNILKRFKKPDPKTNFDQFGSSKLLFALRYCNQKNVPPPPDPRDLTIHFVDDHGVATDKPFPQCEYSELLLALHGPARPDQGKPESKLSKDQRAQLTAARNAIAEFIDEPEKHVVAQLGRDIAYYSLVRIGEADWGRALAAAAKAVNALSPDSNDE